MSSRFFTLLARECCGLVWLMVAAALATLCLTSYAEEARLESAALSDDSAQPFYFTLPAPRGQILDRNGKPLARTVVVHRLMLRVSKLERETPESFVEWVDRHWPAIVHACPLASRPDLDTIRQHFEHRRRLPIAISGALQGEDDVAVDSASLPEGVEVQTEYARDYPGGSLAAHVMGYVTSAGAPLRGPLQYGEPLWRPVEGRDGLEASMNADLTGQPGLLLVCYNKDGKMTQRHVMTPPTPGRNVITTLDIEMQRAAEKALASAKRPGAMIIVDSSTGSLLALASAPTFDPGVFSRGLDKESFEKIKADDEQPLFHRAVSALYPPGSVFKPFVAIAGMREGRLNPVVRIPCGPELTIEGRKFHNWSDSDSGWFDLNSAIVRSCNTYFYQAAITVGDEPILATARDFGFGAKIGLPLAGVASGYVPDRVPTAQAQANLAIGQSPILTTPLEVAMAMATLADGHRRPRARLVSQVQDQNETVTATTAPAWDGSINIPNDALVRVHNAMYSVVNHRNGTATRARVKSLPVYGKTGTAQWSREGEQVNAVWFAGFVKDTSPPLAFVVALEGRKGERLFGGSAASPLAGEVLNSIAASPKTYGMQIAKTVAPLQDYELGNQSPVPLPASALTMIDPWLGRGYHPDSGATDGYAYVNGYNYANAVAAAQVNGATMWPSVPRYALPEYGYHPNYDRSMYAPPGQYAPATNSGRMITMPPTPSPSQRPPVPASALPGAMYTPRTIYGLPSRAQPQEDVRPAIPVDSNDQIVRELPSMPPGYELRYESPLPHGRVRKGFSFRLR